MSAVGLAGAVADAHPVVLAAAHWIARAQRRLRCRARTVRRHAARPRRTALMLFRVFTVLAVVALVISTWILSSPARRPQTKGDAKQADLPGYYLKNAVLTDYDVAGNPSIRIEAERIDQIAHGNEVALYNVRVTYQAPNGQTWVMVGDVAHVEPGGKVVDVTRQRAAAGRSHRPRGHCRGAHRHLELRRRQTPWRAPRATCASISRNIL